MARLRVRATDNQKWLDICTSDFFIRNNSNQAWLRLQANGFLGVRSGDNRYWLAVSCVDVDSQCGIETPLVDDNFEYCE